MAPFTSSLLLLLLLLLHLLLWDAKPTSAKWQTLSGQAPVVIANGGTSGLYPDQTVAAYNDSLLYSVPGVVITCDLQMSKSLQAQFLSSGTGICRTNLNLQNSTVIANYGPQFKNNTYVIDGVSTFGWFAIDIPYENLTQVALAAQSNIARSEAYDGQFPIQKPEFLKGILSATPASTWWLNSEYTSFIEMNSKFNATLYLQEAVQQLIPGYVSVPEISLLKTIQAAANTSGTKVIYKFLENALMDASTNQTYKALLQNLTYIKTLASGILVPKSFIWPINPNNNYLEAPTSLVEDAHKVKLEVYAYNFANDQFPNSYNYTLDPITEILYFIESYNFSVDGIFTDFPTTASEAISCYASNSRNSSLQDKESILQKQKVISHNGYSGKYPGSTTAAYYAAIQADVDYIDCTVQISKDGFPFCRDSVNLLETTNVANSAFFQTYLKTYPGFYGSNPGVYTFDLMWDQISTLSSIMYSPIKNMPRDPSYDTQFDIIDLANFLAIAKNHSVGALIDIQNAIYIREQHNLAVTDAVADTLSKAGYNSTDQVILQSNESAVLARLRDLNVTYPLMYLVPNDPAISLNATDFAEIKQYASSVNLNARLMEPYDVNYFLKGPPPNWIKLAHDQNLTTYFEIHMNEFRSLAFDLRADPTLQLFSLAYYGIDGFVTDYPLTVVNYLDNQCIGNGLTSSTVNFSIPLVVPGGLGSQLLAVAPAAAPAPDLVVPEPPLSGVPLTPAPAPIPASGSRVSTCMVVAVLSVVLHLVAIM